MFSVLFIISFLLNYSITLRGEKRRQKKEKDKIKTK